MKKLKYKNMFWKYNNPLINIRQKRELTKKLCVSEYKEGIEKREQ